jgi:hypothetical protein
MSEVKLAAVVVRHFRSIPGAEVYQEVAPWGSHGSRADVVVTIGPVVHVIEVKASFSLDVIEQAWYWRGRNYAHRVSVAIPAGRRGWFRAEVCERLGIGVLGVEVAQMEWETSRVKEIVAAPLHRTASVREIRRALCEEAKTYAAAGNDASKFWSPFKATCAALREVVTAEQGLTWREAMKRVKHHYQSDSSAASTLHRLATGNYGTEELTWLECSTGRPARLYLRGSVPIQRSAPLFTTERTA